jgi:hypothetical protein
MFFYRSTLLRVLVASASIPFVAAQTPTPITTDDLYAKISSTAAPPGFNVEGGSVFTNFVNALNNKQLFYLETGSSVYEKPATEPVQLTFLNWCSDLTFSNVDMSSLMGYAGRCVGMFLAGYTDIIAAGADLTYYEYSEGDFGGTSGISAVFVEKQNLFEGQYHSNSDDLVFRYWDDGSKTAHAIGWEGHDEGDMASNAATASWSSFREITWMSVEEVAQLLNTTTDEFTPDTFKQVYKDTWVKSHLAQAKIQTNTAEAALAIIEEVKNEKDSAIETTTPAEPETEQDGSSGADSAAPIDDGSAGSERKLTSVATRFVSAALRVFGI